MGKKMYRDDIRVIVYPDTPSWRNEGLTLQDAEDIAEQIRRHVDGIAANGVQVTWDASYVCEHCGHAWTEDSDTYNGGCCDKDLESAPDDEVLAEQHRTATKFTGLR